MATETMIPVGSICHNDDKSSDPNHRRVGLWLDAEGQLWADADSPHVAHGDRFGNVESARAAARSKWSGSEWAYRDED